MRNINQNSLFLGNSSSSPAPCLQTALNDQLSTEAVPSTAASDVKVNQIMKPLMATASVLLGMSAAAVAADTVGSVGASPPVVEKVPLGPAPTDFGLKNDYYADCQQVGVFSFSSY